MTSRLILALVPAALVAGATAPAAAPVADGTAATAIRIGSHPAHVRVVVDLTGRALVREEVTATDHRPADGSVTIRVRRRAAQGVAMSARRAGVRARLTSSRNRLLLRLSVRRGRFKEVQVTTLRNPVRLVADLYRARPPVPAGEIRTGRGGCLAISGVERRTRSFRVRGRERDLFEHAFVLRVRDDRGRVVGRRPVTAAGRWSASVRYAVRRRQPGTLEAVASSANDGSLDCIAQLRVALRP